MKEKIISKIKQTFCGIMAIILIYAYFSSIIAIIKSLFILSELNFIQFILIILLGYVLGERFYKED